LNLPSEFHNCNLQISVIHLLSPFIAFIVITNVLALKKIELIVQKLRLKKKFILSIKSFLILTILLSGILLTKEHFLIRGSRSIYSTLEIWKLIRLIPPDASVATDGSLIAALSSRKKAFSYHEMQSIVSNKDLDYMLYVKINEMLENSQLNVKNFNVVAENEFYVLLKNKDKSITHK